MRSGVRPIKKLSQNFLIDSNIAEKIVNCMNIEPEDRIVEIGPGEGILTRYLVRSPASMVTAVEKDRRLIPHLEKQFGDYKCFCAINQDFLKTDVQPFTMNGRKIRCIGNLPYSITSLILFYVLENRKYISDMTVMVQKEVGERLAADPNTKAYGIPSVLFRAVSDIKMLFTVSRNAFRPIPEVTSIVMRICFHESPKYQISDWSRFHSIVRTAFHQRRKMLRKTLKQWVGAHECPINLTKRPEQLHIHEWVQLSNFTYNQIPPVIAHSNNHI